MNFTPTKTVTKMYRMYRRINLIDKVGSSFDIKENVFNNVFGGYSRFGGFSSLFPGFFWNNK